MENVFEFRDNVINEYSNFSRSFTRIQAQDIREFVESEYAVGRYWPEPLIQINPNYQRKESVQELARQGLLHNSCAEIFLEGKPDGKANPLHLFTHQLEAIANAREDKSYVVTTGTGSGKSLSFFIPIIDRILKAKELDPTPRTRAIVIYPMNALANSQLEELSKFLHGYAPNQKPFTVARYTGQEKDQDRKDIASNPPDILLTNFMMLELILTRYEEKDRQVVEHCRGLDFLVLDELHTYRGRQGADVAMLVRRLRQRLEANNLICIGTSATMSSTGTTEDQQKTVAKVASKLFGATITAHEVIGETLERVTDSSLDLAAVVPHLKERIRNKPFNWIDYGEFQRDPLAVWVELTLGIDMNELAKPKRAKPITLSEASKRLSDDAGLDLEKARNALQTFLVSAHSLRTSLGRPPFAFKLHQFISGPGKVHATLEAEGQRHITLDAQRFAPGRQADNVFLYGNHIGIEFRWSKTGEAVDSTIFSARYRLGQAGAADLDYLRLGRDGQGFTVERRKEGIYRLMLGNERLSRGQSADFRPLRSFAFSPAALERLKKDGERIGAIGPQLLDELSRIIYLGPVRRLAQRDYVWSGRMPSTIGDDGNKAVDALIASGVAGKIAAKKRKPTPPEARLITETSKWLKRMELADELSVKQLGNSARYELMIMRGGESTNIKDVGVGVSQVLPVIVAALHAAPGHIVIIEEPESHLHPLAESLLAELFATVSKERGVQFIIETHSEHMFRRMQTLIAKKDVLPPHCAMYFVEREGTQAKLRELVPDEVGRIKSWPPNFFGDALGESRIQAELAIKHIKEMRAKNVNISG